MRIRLVSQLPVVVPVNIRWQHFIKACALWDLEGADLVRIMAASLVGNFQKPDLKVT